jgi:hypothetical protein
MRLVIAALAALVLQGCASAAPVFTHAEVQIVNRTTGQVLPTYAHDGRLYVAGTPGEKYAVRLANRAAGRVLAVLSVDGINAVTGETAAPDQNGYVLAPGQSFEINGWRKSMNEVAAFYFTRLPDSYAARTDRPENVGVIGVAVFRERERPRPPQVLRDEVPSSPRAANEAAAGADALSRLPPEAKRAERIGTGHGERERSDVVYTDFRRATALPAETITILYDTHANLVARGVIPRDRSVVTPNPFPGGRFVPDPRG